MFTIHKTRFTGSSQILSVDRVHGVRVNSRSRVAKWCRIKKLTSVFYASVLLLIVNFVITLLIIGQTH